MATRSLLKLSLGYLLYINMTRTPSNWSILCLLTTLWVCLNSLNAQSVVNQDRLIATKTESYWSLTDWEPIDSNRYVYSGFNNQMHSQLPTIAFNGLQGHLPTSYLNSPVHFTPLFGPLSSTAIPFLEGLAFDQKYHLGPDYTDTEVEWDIEQQTVRYYEGQNLISETFYASMPDADNYDRFAISWNDEGQPSSISHTIAFGDEEDSITQYSYQYSDELLTNSTYYEFPTWIGRSKKQSVDYTYNDKMLPIEEIWRSYQTTEENEGGLSYKWEYTYNEFDLVSKATLFAINDGEWIEWKSFNFTFTEDQLDESFTIYRDIDTVSLPITLGDWDTLNHQTYYWTQNRLDSVISYKSHYSYSGELELYFQEFYTYENDRINNVTIDYADNITVFEDLEKHFFYDDKGNIAEVLTYFSENDGSYIFAFDSIFHYNEEGNMILMEFAEGSSYNSKDDIELPVTSRTHYYYEGNDLAGIGDDDLFIQVYPSPAINNITILIGSNNFEFVDAELIIYASDGRQILHERVSFSELMELNLDCNSWGSGTYYVKAVSGPNISIQNIVLL